MKEIGIGLLGFGTVGSGLVQALQHNGDTISARLGVKLVLRRIADVDLDRDRGVTVDPKIMTRDAAAVIRDPAVDIVVELIGGTGAARTFVKMALEQGKPVVTANKALLAEYGEEIFGLAEKKKVDLYFGASVGGGIPIIRVLREGLVGNGIESISGILNGTCNYILTRMETDGLPFDKALAEAQAAGFAEADPSLDVDGIDTAHKAVILASLAYGFHVPMSAVLIEGIRGISEVDIQYASDLGYRIKLLAVIKRNDSEVEVRVHPTMVPRHHMLASVSGVFNAVMVHGDLSGNTLYYGRGAGREPTASTVVGDISDIARNLAASVPRRFPALSRLGRNLRLRDLGDARGRYYLRLSVLDRPGGLARIAAALGAHGISIASVLQKEGGSGEYVPVVAITHQSCERDCDAALAEIDGMDIIGDKTVRFRIEG